MAEAGMAPEVISSTWLVQHVDGGLRRDDEVADDHGDGDQDPVRRFPAMLWPRKLPAGMKPTLTPVRKNTRPR